jgi:glycosyltransferase involved in cell wall biosynthesis
MSTPYAALKVLHVAQTAQGGVASYLEEIMPLQAAIYGPDSVRAVLPAEHAAAYPGLLPRWLLTFPAAAGRLLSTWRMTATALRAIREWRPDVVHLHSTFAGLAMRPLLQFFGARPVIVYCAHGWSFDRRAGRLQLWMFERVERALSRLCDSIVCVSHKDFERGSSAGIPQDKMMVVLNGIADRTGAGLQPMSEAWPHTGLKVLFVGRLDTQKGVDVLLGAMRQLGARASAIVVGSAIVGDAKAHTAPANVKVLGWLPRDQIERLYASADVLVMPSRWEGLPIVALEAMRAGLPVIATRVGGIPEVVEDGVTGKLIDADAPAQLVAVLSTLDPDTLHAMGTRARERFLKTFQIPRVVNELDTLYRELKPQ